MPKLPPSGHLPESAAHFGGERETCSTRSRSTRSRSTWASSTLHSWSQSRPRLRSLLSSSRRTRSLQGRRRVLCLGGLGAFCFFLFLVLSFPSADLVTFHVNQLEGGIVHQFERTHRLEIVVTVQVLRWRKPLGDREL
jgi:hypothetical protein